MNYCSVAYTFFKMDYRVRRYAELLVKPGNRIDAIALRSANNHSAEQVHGINVYCIQKRDFDEKGPLSYLLKIVSFFIIGSFVLLRNHIRYHYDVIHIHNVPDFLVFMALIPKLMGAKVILDIHDIVPEFYCQKFNTATDSYLVIALKLVEKLSLKFADHIIVANDLWREKIIVRDRIQPKRITTLMNYPNLEFYRPNHRNGSNDQLKIIYPGHLSYHHGVDILIKAIYLVKESVPEVQLDIYPSSFVYNYRKYLEKLILCLGITNNVKFCQPLNIDGIAEKLENATLGVVPKRAGVFAAEAFSTKIFDFMAACVPVIASKTKIDEFYFNSSTIRFFEEENYVDLAEAIIELYKEKNTCESMVLNANKFIYDNNWAKKNVVYNGIIKKLIF